MKPSGTARRYWPISIGVHVVLLGLIFFIPSKQYFQDSGDRRKPPAPPEIKRRGEDLERVMEQVRDIAAERIASKVALLDQGAQRMTTNFDTLNKFYQPTEDQQRDTAAERMQVFAQRVLADMTTMQTKLDTARQAEQPEAKLAALKAAQPLGSRVLVAQEEVRRGLMFLASENETLVATQAEAEKAQLSAVEFIGWSSGSLNHFISTARDLNELRPEEAKLSKALQAAKTPAEEAAAKLETVRQQLKDARDERNRRNRELTAEAKAELDSKIKALDANQRTLADLARKTRSELQVIERDWNRAKSRLENAQQTYTELDKERSWENNLNVAVNVQTSAFNAQRTVINTLLEQAGKAPIFTNE